ncbi:MAG TPA: TetR/AcrR family transcriptional regulator [Candidatus Bariatricus faecipullorum]|nr:TetR/AcrR family transcriptional regulator [Candidatus Bariatricus faecipullorum]
MRQNEKEPLSRQQQKSKETKDRIFHAAKTILQRQGYDQLSIKNICEEAGVSNGSFYHHFKTKDDLLSYYIEEQPSINPDLLDMPENAEEAKIAIIHVYLNYAEYCRELGVDFISNYYTPKNQALNPDIRTERPYPILTVENYLKKAIDAGIVSPKLPLADICTDIRMLVIGNVFEWCVHHGETDFEGNIRRSIGGYLDGVF